MSKKSNKRFKIASLESISKESPNFINPNHIDKNNDKYPYFSFRYICIKKYCMNKCNFKQLKSLTNTLRILSNLEWRQIEKEDHKKNGYEPLPQNIFKPSMPNIVNENERILIFRFNKGRIAGIRRDNKFYILFIDHDFTLYDHGS